jgi:hypothetical protein
MTIARDMSGAVIGQLVFSYTKGIAALNPSYTLLTRDGEYVSVPATSVRLEKVT